MNKLSTLFIILFLVFVAFIVGNEVKDSFKPAISTQVADDIVAPARPKTSSANFNQSLSGNSVGTSRSKDTSKPKGSGSQPLFAPPAGSQASTQDAAAGVETDTPPVEVVEPTIDNELVSSSQDADPADDSHSEAVNLPAKSDAKIEPLERLNVSVSGGQPVWTTGDGEQYSANESVSQIDIRVAGQNGSMHTASFKQGQTLMMPGTLPDGAYNWEVVTVPKLDPAMKEALQLARQNQTQEEQQRLMQQYRDRGMLPSDEQARANRQSGHFRIQDGAMVEDTAEKP